jgi:GntR family transcriptional repressor for pyruvate dehydrogenase complex
LRRFTRPEIRDRFRAQHQAIYDSVMAGDVEAAGEAAEAHIHATHQACAEVREAEARLQVSLRRLNGGHVSARRKGDR